MIRERGITLELCPTSNLNTRVVSGWDEFRWIFDTFRRNGVRYTINTDGPEMLKTYIRDEMTTLGRLGILSVEEQAQSAEWARQASFVGRRQRHSAAAPQAGVARRPGARRGLSRAPPRDEQQQHQEEAENTQAQAPAPLSLAPKGVDRHSPRLTLGVYPEASTYSAACCHGRRTLAAPVTIRAPNDAHLNAIGRGDWRQDRVQPSTFGKRFALAAVPTVLALLINGLPCRGGRSAPAGHGHQRPGGRFGPPGIRGCERHRLLLCL